MFVCFFFLFAKEKKRVYCAVAIGRLFRASLGGTGRCRRDPSGPTLLRQRQNTQWDRALFCFGITAGCG